MGKRIRAKTLREQQTGEISMIEAGGRRNADRWFAAKGDTEAGRLQHRQVIGTIADGQAIAERQTVLGGTRDQSFLFHVFVFMFVIFISPGASNRVVLCEIARIDH